jgi:hypothetical protein
MTYNMNSTFFPILRGSHFTLLHSPDTPDLLISPPHTPDSVYSPDSLIFSHESGTGSSQVARNLPGEIQQPVRRSNRLAFTTIREHAPCLL